jgi:hypothetical protein
MVAGAPHQLAFECCDLIVKGAPSRQHGLDHQPQLGVVREAGAHLGLESSAAAFWQDQAEDVHQTADLVDHLGPHIDQLLADPKSRVHEMTLDALDLDLPVPSRADDLGQAVGVVGVALVDLHRQGCPSVTRVQAPTGSSRIRSSCTSQGVSGPLSSPTRTSEVPRLASACAIAVGEVAQVPRQITNPRSSTMLTVVLACDTSSPAKTGIAALRSG